MSHKKSEEYLKNTNQTQLVELKIFIHASVLSRMLAGAKREGRTLPDYLSNIVIVREGMIQMSSRGRA